MWLCISAIATYSRLRQEDCELETILGYVILPCQQDKNRKILQKNIAVEYVKESGQNYVHLSKMRIIDVASLMRMCEKPEYCFHSKDRNNRGCNMS